MDQAPCWVSMRKPLGQVIVLISTEYELGHHHLLLVYRSPSHIDILTRQTGSISLTYSSRTLVNGCECFFRFMGPLLI